MPGPLPRAAPRPLGDREAALLRELKSERRRALASPRQLARFLCGLPSPLATRERLGHDRRFGALAGVPFQDVLAFAERTR